MGDGLIIDVKIPTRVKVEGGLVESVRELINKYGEDRVVEALSKVYEYEVIRSIGDVYSDAIVMSDTDFEALEECLQGGGVNG